MITVSRVSKLRLGTLSGSLALVLLAFYAALSPLRVQAVARTWDGGCGTNTNWSCAANWSGDVVPAAADTITFNTTSLNNSTIDAAFNPTETVASLSITSAYTGTITLGTSLHVTGAYIQAGGNR